MGNGVNKGVWIWSNEKWIKNILPFKRRGCNELTSHNQPASCSLSMVLLGRNICLPFLGITSRQIVKQVQYITDTNEKTEGKNATKGYLQKLFFNNVQNAQILKLPMIFMPLIK